jgi:general secretion pathway protein L
MDLPNTMRLRQAPAAALSWWLGELVALVPAAWRARLSTSGGPLLLAIDGDTVTISHPDGGRQAHPISPRQGKVPDDIAPVLQRARRGALKICLLLPAQRGLRSRMRLPLAAEENLREAIGFELDRQTPFRADDVFFTYRLADRDTDLERLVVELTVVPRIVVTEALARAANLGLTPSRVEVADASGAPASGNLLPAGLGPSRLRAAQLYPGALAMLALLLAVAVVVIPLERASRTAEGLRSQVDAARKDAEAGMRLQAEIARRGEESNFLANRKRELPSVSEMLYELTRRLPDEAWLSDLHLAGSDLQFSGSAASATSLLESLDRSPFFADAGFRAPILRDTKLDRETFQIGMRIVRDKAK